MTVDVEGGPAQSPTDGDKFASAKTRVKKCCTRKVCCCSLWTCSLVTPILVYFLTAIIWGVASAKILWGLPQAFGHQQFDRWATDADEFVISPQLGIPSYEWWPGCIGEKDGVDPTDRSRSGSFYKRFQADPNDTSYFTNCGTSCCDCDEIPLYRTLNANAGGFNVRIPARKGADKQDDAVLSAWWLPAPGAPADGPVIIVQHGMAGTHKDGRANMIAYLLRTSGFSVLMASFRDHGGSSPTSHKSQSWGYDYPLDILGCVDYVVNDPHNKLGGPRLRNKVGVLGLSMGSFVAAAAFGMDHEIPALWVDGVIGDPKGVVVSVCPFTKTWAEMILPISWSIAKNRAPVEFDLYSPEQTLKTGPATNRPIMVAGSTDDINTPVWMMEDFIDMAKNAGGGKYSVSKWLVTGGYCTSQVGGKDECSLVQVIDRTCTFTHNILTWTHTAQYRQKLCDFWSQSLLGTPCQAETPEWYVMKSQGLV